MVASTRAQTSGGGGAKANDGGRKRSFKVQYVWFWSGGGVNTARKSRASLLSHHPAPSNAAVLVSCHHSRLSLSLPKLSHPLYASPLSTPPPPPIRF